MVYLLTDKEILILSKHIYLFTKSIIIRGNYILTRNYNHFHRRPKLIVCILYGTSGGSERFMPYETIFIEHCCIRGIAEIFIQKLPPATLL